MKKFTRNLVAALFMASLLFTACMEDEFAPMELPTNIDQIDALDYDFTDGTEEDSTRGPEG